MGMGQDRSTFVVSWRDRSTFVGFRRDKSTSAGLGQDRMVCVSGVGYGSQSILVSFSGLS